MAGKKEKLDDLDQANAEIEKLRKLGEKLTGELQGNVVNTACILRCLVHGFTVKPQLFKNAKFKQIFWLVH